MRSLYVFTCDLRLHDNALLKYLADKSQALYCLYIFDNRIHIKNVFSEQLQCSGLSENRKRFLKQSLYDLEKNLADLNQVLHYQTGDTVTILQALQKQFNFDAIGLSFHAGVYEQKIYSSLQAADLPLIDRDRAEQFTLLQSHQNIVKPEYLKGSFTQFRKKIEPLIKNIKVDDVKQLPPPVVAKPADLSLDEILPVDDKATSDFIGGETAALKQLTYYCQPGRLDAYKETRNGLYGWDFSSKVSPWLANGCLSVRRLWLTNLEFEQIYGANDSTYWLRFELLWREYFQWLLLLHQKSFFAFSGISGHTPTSTFKQESYQTWINAQTGFNGVDAAMRQLRQTGWLSNRARQWVASCFIHELNLDWRYGAAFFEQQLIDFDVASNWGNWQYLAGVGTDPRGSRRFNLEKQLAMYDPDGAFCAQYGD